jgi:hypothetical protein
MKRRICSYDMAAVPEDSYIVTDKEGEIYLCNVRCLCIWSITLATKAGLNEELKARRLVLKVPAGEELVFETIIGLAVVFPLPAQLICLSIGPLLQGVVMDSSTASRSRRRVLAN